jgi:protein SCO1/2
MRRVTLLLALVLGLAAPAQAGPPPATAAVDLEEHLGRSLDRALTLTDQEGATVHLGDLLDGRRPVVLVLAYYRCPMLCGLVLRGVVDGLNDLRYTLGADYRALTVSIDPRDTPAAARAKRRSTLGALARGAEAPGAWPFLVGRPEALTQLADAVGFRYAYDARTDQFAHPAAAIVLTPDGRVSRYLYGVAPSARDLRLALVEAGEGRTGGLVDRVLMTCYRYDPAARAYGPYVVGFLRLGGVFILAAVGGLVVALFRREARLSREARAR